MLIKRLNKIMAPSPTPNKTEIEPLKVSSVRVDPHGRYILLYNNETDTIFITTIHSILNHISQFANSYSVNCGYSFFDALPVDLKIVNPRPSENILQIKLSQNINGTQFFVVAYFCGICDLYSIVSGKKIDTIDIAERCLRGQPFGEGPGYAKNYNPLGKEAKKNDSKVVCSQIYNVNVIGHSLFISLYDGKLVCYEGRQFGICCKYEDQWMRICYSQQAQSQQAPKIVPIYEDTHKNLKQGQKILIESRRPALISTKLSQSYIQFLKLEQEKVNICNNNNMGNARYWLSLCGGYLVCWNQQYITMRGKNENEKKEENVSKETDKDYDGVEIVQGFYEIRARKNKWEAIKDVKFSSVPVINHFQNPTTPKPQNPQLLLIAQIGNYTPSFSPIQSSQTLSILTLNPSHCPPSLSLVCKITEIKRNIIQIQWIGPSMLLYVEEEVQNWLIRDQQLGEDQ